MTYAHRSFPKKRAVNVSLSEDLIDGAKAHGINLSELIERRIASEIREMNMRQFCDENSEAIEAANRRVRETGTFAERFGVIFDRIDRP
ncbi:MAG: type II toxin-antitoxin system CcdA family antitoxin [Litorimonas sp.]